MRLPRIHVFALCLFLPVSGLTACSGEEDDNDQVISENNQEQNGDDDNGDDDNGDDDNGDDDNGDNGDNDDDDEFPSNGIYEVTSHVESTDGCNGDTDDVDESDYVRLYGQTPPGADFINWSMEWCDSPSEDSCTTSALNMPNTDADAELDTGDIYESRHISTAASDGEQCSLDGTGSELEITDDGAIVRNLVLELEFSLSEEDWDCDRSADDPSEATYDALECAEIETLEVQLVESL